MKIKILFTIIFIYKYLFGISYAGLAFSEILPNTLDDKNLEYIEIYNSGNIEKSLSGYILNDKSGKEYIFSSGSFLLGEEKKKFFRNETKIILNNSDEEIYLYDDLGVLLNSFSYDNSIKGEVISIDLGNIIDEENSDIIDNEDNLIIDKGTGVVDSNNGTGIIESYLEENIIIPEIIYSFQSPTYLLEKDKNIDIYNCDNSKENCKINIDLSLSFDGDFIQKDFECILNFGFITGEESKCNPASFIVPLGSYNLKFKIQSRINSNYFKIKNIKIINNGYVKPVKIIIKKRFSSSRTKNSDVPLRKPIKIKEPHIIIQSGLNEKNECSNLKNCGINLKYGPRHKLEKCLWNFGSGSYDLGTEQKCDPGYIKYGTGKFIVSLKVYERDIKSNFQINELIFTNGYNKEIKSLNIIKKVKIEDIKLVNLTNSEESKVLIDNIEIKNLKPIISIQGKIGKNKILKGNTLTCYDNCSINFDGSNSIGNIEKFSWDFGNGEKYEGPNPGYIKYNKYGTYKVNLVIVSDTGNIEITDFKVNYFKKLISKKVKKKSIKKKKTSIISKVEASDDYETTILNDVSDDKESDIIIYYILILIFGFILIIVLLKREKLL